MASDGMASPLSIGDGQVVSCLICNEEFDSSLLWGHVAVSHFQFIRYRCQSCQAQFCYNDEMLAHSVAADHELVPEDLAVAQPFKARLVELVTLQSRQVSIAAGEAARETLRQSISEQMKNCVEEIAVATNNNVTLMPKVEVGVSNRAAAATSQSTGSKRKYVKKEKKTSLPPTPVEMSSRVAHSSSRKKAAMIRRGRGRPSSSTSGSHSGADFLRCTTCPAKRFPRSEYESTLMRERHVWGKHVDDRRNGCGWCDFRSRRRMAVREHIKKIHPRKSINIVDLTKTEEFITAFRTHFSKCFPSLRIPKVQVDRKIKQEPSGDDPAGPSKSQGITLKKPARKLSRDAGSSRLSTPTSSRYETRSASDPKSTCSTSSTPTVTKSGRLTNPIRRFQVEESSKGRDQSPLTGGGTSGKSASVVTVGTRKRLAVEESDSEADECQSDSSSAVGQKKQRKMPRLEISDDEECEQQVAKTEKESPCTRSLRHRQLDAVGPTSSGLQKRSGTPQRQAKLKAAVEIHRCLDKEADQLADECDLPPEPQLSNSQDELDKEESPPSPSRPGSAPFACGPSLLFSQVEPLHYSSTSNQPIVEERPVVETDSPVDPKDDGNSVPNGSSMPSPQVSRKHVESLTTRKIKTEVDVEPIKVKVEPPEIPSVKSAAAKGASLPLVVETNDHKCCGAAMPRGAVGKCEVIVGRSDEELDDHIYAHLYNRGYLAYECNGCIWNSSVLAEARRHACWLNPGKVWKPSQPKRVTDSRGRERYLEFFKLQWMSSFPLLPVRPPKLDPIVVIPPPTTSSSAPPPVAEPPKVKEEPSDNFFASLERRVQHRLSAIEKDDSDIEIVWETPKK